MTLANCSISILFCFVPFCCCCNAWVPYEPQQHTDLHIFRSVFIMWYHLNEMYFWYTHLLLLIHIFNGNTPVRQRKKENGCQKEEREEIVRWVASLAYTSVCFCVWKNRQLAPGTMHVIVKFGRRETLGSAKKNGALKTKKVKKRKSFSILWFVWMIFSAELGLFDLHIQNSSPNSNHYCIIEKETVKCFE